MTIATRPSRLLMLPRSDYVPADEHDPIRFYHLPLIGALYRRRVELCLGECTGGQRVLEVGFGSGVTFLNLAAMYEEIYGLDLTAPVDRVTAAFAARGLTTHLCNGSVLDMPYPDNHFDTVLLISILEHLRPHHQAAAFREIARVLRPEGQVVYGVPVERPLMVWLFRLLGCNIREHHFSTQDDVSTAARQVFGHGRITPMCSIPPFRGSVYEVGHFVKN